MNEELVKMRNKMENLKQDRFRDQKIINSLDLKPLVNLERKIIEKFIIY